MIIYRNAPVKGVHRLKFKALKGHRKTSITKGFMI